MSPYPRFVCFLSLSILLLPVLTLEAAPSQPGTAEEAFIEQLRPMQTDGIVDKRLLRVLESYYQSGYGGPNNWAQIESVRFEGRLIMPDGSVRFLAYKKKPDLCKIVLYTGPEDYVVMAYDGKDAWQLNTRAADPSPQSMPSDEALNFIRDATTGSQLLFPILPGKKIELGRTVEVDGEKCLEVQVTLPNGQMVDYALSLLNFAQQRQTTVNAVSGDTEVTTHYDFRVIRDVRFPVRSVLRIDGEEVHRLEINEIELNTGAMPWMFQRPSLEHIPEPSAEVKDLPGALGSRFNSSSSSAFDLETGPTGAMTDLFSPKTGISSFGAEPLRQKSTPTPVNSAKPSAK